MNRREFLSYCVSAGITIGMGNLVSCMGPRVSLTPADKAQLRGLRVADTHAHPYDMASYERSTPTIEMMKQLNIVASSFCAVGDMVKYEGMYGRPFHDTLNQLIKVIRL